MRNQEASWRGAWAVMLVALALGSALGLSLGCSSTNPQKAASEPRPQPSQAGNPGFDAAGQNTAGLPADNPGGMSQGSQAGQGAQGGHAGHAGHAGQAGEPGLGGENENPEGGTSGNGPGANLAGGNLAGDKTGEASPEIPTCAPNSVLALEDTGPTEAGWQDRYDSALEDVISRASFDIKQTNTDADDGKRTWSPLLVKLWQSRNNPQARQNLFVDQGARVLEQRHSGQLWKPFSIPGMALYYKAYKDQLPDAQKSTIRDRLYNKDNNDRPYHSGLTGWQNLRRGDRNVDPIYPITEFNSENFLWMMRLGGYIFAHDFGNDAQKPFFDTFIKNLVRATFNLGRVEWDSNNYSAWSFHPALVAYEYAATPEDKARLKAVLDWMVITSALHYLDGFWVGPDVRAKNEAHERFAGSGWMYAYFYFQRDDGDQAFPSFSRAEMARKNLSQLMGYLVHSTYKPPQVAIDIARRNFETPVEMHNAKPFYGMDEDSYADWAGGTARSRRFEFETLYLHDNYTLGSVATFRPDGNAIFAAANPNFILFSEQRLWALGSNSRRVGPCNFLGALDTRTAMGKNTRWGATPLRKSANTEMS